ncbi:MAG TPA: DHH family phosphoesterase, partial [Terrimicrobiaceae bacterium]
MQQRWIFPSTERDHLIRRLSRELNVPEFVAGVLTRNGLGDLDAASNFLEPRLGHLQDPFLLPEMEEAISRIRRAIEQGERIVLYGDYDVDGVASLAFLHRTLTACGARVTCFLPVRAQEGYGLSPSGIERCFEEHTPQLLVAVDCGTNSIQEVASIRERG